MSDIADILDKAADLIEPEGAWVQGPVAVDRDGDEACVYGPDACSWCALGAIWRAAAEAGLENRWQAERPVWMLLGQSSIATFNDAPGRTQEEVVAKLREAAAKARGQS